MKKDKIFFTEINSPLGKIIIGAWGSHLCLLQFAGENIKEKIRKRFKTGIVYSDNLPVLKLTENQLKEYFEGKRKVFDVPLKFAVGTDFQKKCWEALLKIPYGETISYSKQAETVGNPKAIRAVANANRLNPIAIIVPCHRVIGKNGKLTGYAGGLNKKEFLLKLEKAILKK